MDMGEGTINRSHSKINFCPTAKIKEGRVVPHGHERKAEGCLLR